MQNPATTPIVGYEGSADVDAQQHWLDVAWRALQAEVPDLVTRAADDETLLALAADVVTAAARRVLRNPDGVKQEAGGIDTWSESRSYSDETQDVYFTAAELRRVTSTAQMSSDFAGSIPYRR
jgi:hypothetical protein